MNLSGKKLLILAGASIHIKVVIAAKEMGIYTIVTDYLDDSPAKAIADESWDIDIKDVDTIVRKCIERKVDGVMNFCIDPAQIPYVEICRRLNLPCIGNVESFRVLTDKRLFKMFCKEHNIGVIPDFSLNDINNDNVSYPVFVKPAVSRGSRGQSVCFSKKETLIAIEKAKKESYDGNFICEKYMNNHQDIASACFVINDEPYIVKFGDRHLGKIEDNLNKLVLCTKLPSNDIDKYDEYLLKTIQIVIDTLGIHYGPIFLQGYLDGNIIRFYDPAQRMPGGDYDTILRELTGFDTVKSWIAFALTGDITTSIGNPINCYKLSGKNVVLLTLTAFPGVIQSFTGLENVSELKEAVYVRQILKKGDTIPDSGDISQRIATIGLVVDDNISNIIERIYQMISVIDENGNSMLVPFTYGDKND